MLKGEGVEGTRVSITAGGITLGSAVDCELVLAARGVSRRHVKMSLHPNGVHIEDLGSLNGTVVGGVVVNDVVVPPGTIVVVGSCEVLVEPETPAVDVPLSLATRLGGLVGKSPSMRKVFAIIERVAPTDYTVLIEGETGTGKEVVARTVHELSGRREQPFVVFDCTTSTESLLESELFGHVKGAFTGAVTARDGAVRRAEGGTLFIDELNSLPLSLQGKLLRVLEARRVQAVGADSDMPVDIRVVAASNANLRGEVAAKRFREDLFFRLSVVDITIPPLRERREDIPLLVKNFLRGAGILAEPEGPNLDRLVGYSWPGNVRELRNTLDRAIALAGTRKIAFADLPISVDDATPTMAWPILLDLPFKDAKEHLTQAFERVYISTILERAGRNISKAARMAGLSRRGFFDLLKRHELASRDDDEE
ncbi:MAG: sigma 54-interacting transcriptional regulator [Kofleriaceae bacterium]